MEGKSRRQILQAIGSLGAYGALFPLASRGAFAQSGHVPAGIRFGVQLNAFPIDPKRFETFEATLELVKQIGYQGFEAGFRFLSEQFAAPEKARRSIEQTGLTFFGIHIFFPDNLYDQTTRIAAPSVYEPVARGGAALGAKHLILSGAPAQNADQLKAKIEALNTAGRFARTAGIAAAYHNHWWEFESKVGEIEALYSQTDPELVHFVLDAGHAFHGGADVPAFIRAHAKRIIGFHLRDFKNNDYVELGTGDFPLHQVAATIEQIGWKGWVENEEERADHSQGGEKVIAPAFKAMREAFTS
ncbi:MAG: sugar phosphate isomerase/epimerase [Terracidiphilus sp.]|nr:sugar phosphate isomerase/epimerase [Terracidiphilus sp.]MDR3796927.1 sugar phosphate isomerase/epimerase [Terracidiphilus sp.]